MGKYLRSAVSSPWRSTIWLLVHTHTGKENQAERAIQASGYDPWLPRIDETPAYPGYLFSRLTDHTDVRELNQCQGVLRVVRYGETLALASDGLIQDLMARAHEIDALEPGDRVELSPEAGIYAYHQGIVVETRADQIILDVLIGTHTARGAFPLRAIA